MWVRRLSVTALGLWLVGCGAQVSDVIAKSPLDSAPETLEQAQALWDAHAVSGYRVTVTQTCFCPPDLRQPLAVSVAGGAVVKIEGLDQPLQEPHRLDSQRLTVAGLFQFIAESAKRDPYKLEVEYDSHFGFPRRIDYDGHPMIADDELQYELTDFRVNAPD
ncbi:MULTISPECIES: DUF6174 domain-containing protein [Marinobacter]|jgi:hypothetical protein|uniref:DUF6174 domain-containing protein n=1 Tax=Marinobacter TaxID=2742 RepID=UPI002003E29D|nr:MULTISPECIES: DUF6174 domain-containing protein [Marinobacter]MCK7551091.1 DUF6174 domain-containing protein [Marinobacter goseongensis]MDV3502644.1 DUF6174 domain-containing protein [Marinobacter sp. M-5]